MYKITKSPSDPDFGEYIEELSAMRYESTPDPNEHREIKLSPDDPDFWIKVELMALEEVEFPDGSNRVNGRFGKSKGFITKKPVKLEISKNVSVSTTPESRVGYETLLLINSDDKKIFDFISKSDKYYKEIKSICSQSLGDLAKILPIFKSGGVIDCHEYTIYKHRYYVKIGNSNRFAFIYRPEWDICKILSVIGHHDDVPNDKGIYSKESKEKLNKIYLGLFNKYQNDFVRLNKEVNAITNT